MQTQQDAARIVEMAGELAFALHDPQPAFSALIPLLDPSGAGARAADLARHCPTCRL